MNREHTIIDYIEVHPNCTGLEIENDLRGLISPDVISRIVTRLVKAGSVSKRRDGNQWHYRAEAIRKMERA